MTKLVCVAGMPMAGSTLMCQLLNEHPDIHCEGHSSPLNNALVYLRSAISDDTFMLSQLDSQFDKTYGHLKSAMQGFVHGWLDGCSESVVVDKNRAWLHNIEMLLELEPDAKIIVCLRELGQIYGSIESQHQKTILLDSVDHLAPLDRFSRADALFAKDKVIGAPLLSVQAIQNLPDAVKAHIYFVRYEDMIAFPVECMSMIYEWLELPVHIIDPDNLKVGIQESDSHYRMKYPHKRHSEILKPEPHVIPPRIQYHIENAYKWYYDSYYQCQK
jgi:sulfotransferase